MNRPRLRRNASLGAFRVLEFAGQDEGHALYTATKSDQDQLYWLLESSAPLYRLSDVGHETFEVKGHHYLAFPVEGTSAALLSRLIGTLDWKFIVPRWAALAQQAGQLHFRGLLLQQGNPLDLNTLLFTSRAELLPLAYGKTSGIGTVFRAPELALGRATPAADVYALGGALLFLLGGGSPDAASLNNLKPARQFDAPAGVKRVLRQATDPDPIKRFRDGAALAGALYAVSPGAAPGPSASPRRPAILVALGLLLLVLVCAIISFGLLFRQGPAVLTNLLLTLTPAPTRIPTAIPSGELALEVLNVNFTPDRMGHIEFRFTRGGQPLGADTPAAFGLTFNGSTLAKVAVDKLSPGVGHTEQDYRYRLNFDVSPLSTTTGTYQITARMIGSALSKTIYFDQSVTFAPESQPNGTPAPGAPGVTGAGQLTGLNITGLQLDSQHYPNLTLYFTVSGNGGSVARLQGPVTVQVEQDGQVVGQLVMAPNDATGNPITVALAMDVSGSMYGPPNVNARRAAGAFVSALGAGDAACVYSFSTVVTRVEPCTTDRQAAVKGIGTLGASGNTSLYDALITIADDLSKLNGRKAIVLLSDGMDTASRTGKENALSQLKQTNIPVYVIGLVSYQYQPAILTEFANATGGSYLAAPAATDLSALYALINAQLKNQYRIDFQSVFPDRMNGTLTVRLLQGDAAIEASYPFSVSK